MEGRNNRNLLIGIAVILLLILFTSSSTEPVYVQTTTDSGGYQESSFYDAINLSENTIALINNDMYSGNYGTIVVLEFNPETNTFNKISDHYFITDFD